MRYSEITLACEKGFYIDPNLVKPLGINNGSYCYGVFVEGSDEDSGKNSSKDLIISAFPYHSWAGLVRLQIRLLKKDIENSIIKLFKILDKKELNILSMQTLCTGYTHHLIDMIVEVSDYRKEYDDKDIKVITEEEVKNALKNIYTEIIFKKMELVKGRIKEKLEINLYKENGWPFNENDAELKEFCVEQVKWEWLHILALHAFNKNRLRFKYKSLHTDGLLTFDAENSFLHDIDDVFKEVNQDYIKKSPFLVMTSFNLLQHHIRLSSIQMKDKNFYTFKTQCRVKISGNKSLTAATMGTRGLTSVILQEIKKNNPNFEFISASVEGLQRENKLNEKCLLSINGLSSNKFNNKQSNAMENTIRKAFTDKVDSKIKKAGEGQQRNEIKLDIYKRRPYKLFLSFRHELIEHSNNKVAIESILKKQGFEVIISLTSVDGITSNVMEKMGECDACLQIYTLSKNEKERVKAGLTKEFIPDHAWLFFEYGLAMQKNMPIGRMIDVTNLPEEQWETHVRINKEGLLVSFEDEIIPNPNNKKSFANQLEKLAEELINKLNSRLKVM